jgi:hypothetical protein
MKAILYVAITCAIGCQQANSGPSTLTEATITTAVKTDSVIPPVQKTLDTALFNSLQSHLVAGHPTAKWPVIASYPLPGAILPYKRIIAYYGNFYAKGMGILGELPPDTMLQHLQREVENWALADTMIPVVPAIHYIAVTAQRSPGAGARYRLRMPANQIEYAIALAKKIDALVFLDVQVGHSTLQEELPPLEPFLKLSQVHLGIDAEYSMKNGAIPCSEIGTFDAADVNYASTYLASLVDKYNIPPKILVVHRFTKGMLTNYRNIQLRPQVQIVINMDGFGFPAKKKDSYTTAVTTEPVQFAGFKLFYKNDKASSPFHIMSPAEVSGLFPSPVYIQYQ